MEQYNNFSIKDEQGEVWRDIPDYEGLYQISNLGRIKSLRRKHGFLIKNTRIIHQELNNGYCRVKIQKDGKVQKILVHRLVLTVFGKPIQGKNEVDHIDTNRSNNNIKNLRWCTKKENANFTATKKRKVSALKEIQSRECVIQAKLHNKLCKKVAMLNKEGDIVRTFNSASEAKRILGYDVSSSCRGEYKTSYKHKGFSFRYIV